MRPAVSRQTALPAPPPALPADFRLTMKKLNRERFMSRGHLYDRFEVDVYANDEAVEAAGSSATPFSAGAIFVKEHFEPKSKGAKRGPLMMMEKRAPGFDPDRGDWRYVVVSAEGAVEADGALEACARCHGEAPRDHVFRIE